MIGSSVKTDFGFNPFVGPHPIETGRKIFGRDHEVDDLYYLLSAERIVMLHSPSGAGKSSLIQAGLIPRLTERFDVWGPTRVNLQPSANQSTTLNRYIRSAVLGFEQQIPAERRRSEEQLTSMTLAEYVANRPRRRSAPQNIVLIFDQFEEILTADPLAIDAKREFFKQLGELLLDPRIWALFGLREDYLPALDPYAQQVPTHLKNWFRLDLLRRDAAREAIVKTTAEGGRQFADDESGQPVVEKLVRDLATMKMQQPDGKFIEQAGLYVEPLQLQVVCRRLWEQLANDKQIIELADVKDSGDVTTALADYYAAEVARLANGDVRVERKLREWVGKRLITPEGIRSQVLRGAGQSEGLDNVLIANLVNMHLVRGEQRDGATWYELAHDRLIEPVRNDNRDWFDDHLHKLQKDASAWEGQGRPTSLLLLGSDLNGAKRWALQNEVLITSIERDFLEASDAQQQQANLRRRLVVILGVVALVALAATGAAYAAFRSAKLAQSDAVASKSSALAAAAQALEEQGKAEAAKQEAKDHKNSALAQAQIAQQQIEVAAAATNEALKQKEAASNIAYVANMNWAGTQLEKGNHEQLFEILDAYLPTVGAAQDESHRRNFYWYYLRQQSPRITVTLKAHKTDEKRTPAVAFLQNKGTLAIASYDGTLDLRDLRNPDKPEVFKLGEGDRGFFTFSANGRIAAMQLEDTTVKLFDVQARKPLPSFKTHASPFFPLELSADGWTLACTHQDGTVKLWNVRTQQAFALKVKVQAKDNVILTLSADGNWLATSDEEGTMKLWDVRNKSESTLLTKPLFEIKEGVTGEMAFSPDGQILAIPSVGGAVRLWNVKEKKEVPSFPYQGENFDTVTFSGDGQVLVAVGRGVFKLWDVKSKREIASIADRERKFISGPFLALSFEGHLLATANDNGEVRLWEIPGKNELVPEDGSSVTSIAFAGDGHSLVSGYEQDHMVRLWDTQTTGKVITLGSHAEMVNSVAFSRDGKTAASAGVDGMVKLWDIENKREIPLPREHSNGVTSVVFSPDGTRLASAGFQEKVKLWDVKCRSVDKILDEQAGAHPKLAFSSDGQMLASSNDDGIVKLWNLQSGHGPTTLKHERLASSVAFSKDGRVLASGGGTIIKLWDVKTGMELTTLKGSASSVAFSPDGMILAAGDGDSVKLWDLRTRRELATLEWHKRRVTSVAFSPDGYTLASGSDDGTIKLWRGATKEGVAQWQKK